MGNSLTDIGGHGRGNGIIKGRVLKRLPHITGKQLEYWCIKYFLGGKMR